MAFTAAPVGYYKTIQDKIYESLVANAAEYANISPYLNYYVSQDRFIPINDGRPQYPCVVIWIQDLQPSTNSGKIYQEETATFVLDMICKGQPVDVTLPNEIRPNSYDDLPDQYAFARLKYLIQQVKEAIFDLTNVDFGLQAGTIATKEWPRYQIIPQNPEETEATVIGGRWYLDVRYAYQPKDIECADMEELRITAENLYAAYYDYTA